MHVLYVGVILVILMKLKEKPLMLSRMVIYLASTPGNAVYDLEYLYLTLLAMLVWVHASHSCCVCWCGILDSYSIHAWR